MSKTTSTSERVEYTGSSTSDGEEREYTTYEIIQEPDDPDEKYEEGYQPWRDL